MRPKTTAKKPKKDRQVCLRFTKDELDALRYIAEAEDRDLSYVLSFFVHLGAKMYNNTGSLLTLRNLRLDFQGHVKFAEHKDGADALKVGNEH